MSHRTARYLEITRPERIVWRTKWLDEPLASAPEARVVLEFKLGSVSHPVGDPAFSSHLITTTIVIPWNFYWKKA
jgi:hypothetical protein